MSLRPAARPGDASAAAPAAELVPVVGIGASAGGLEALQRLFEHAPTQAGVAWVVVQHLSPEHRSLMDELIARHTAMPVAVVEPGTVLRADHVHLIPPASLLHLQGARLALTPRGDEGPVHPVDVFFASMAASHGRACAALVLSGTGADGAVGVGAVHAAGGLVLVQAPASARFDGMPRAAIASGSVDAVAEPEALAALAVEHLRRRPAAGPPRDDGLDAVLAWLRREGGIDFALYKAEMVRRRVERRARLAGAATLHDYRGRLARDAAECAALRRELLIAVTDFFRDADAFEALETKAIAPLVAAKAPGEAVRVWLAGVCTGEEAYSVTMLLLEAFEAARRPPALKVFATDADERVLEVASLGVYAAAACEGIGAARRARFFEPHGATWQAGAALRAPVTFVRHDLLADPPFTRMDLVVCRNLLIYFKPQAQQRALDRLLHALRPGGFLFLGSSESPGAAQSMLRAVDAHRKLFQRLDDAAPRRRDGAPAPGAHGASRPSVTARAVAQLAEHHAPATLLVDAEARVVHALGRWDGPLRDLRIDVGGAASQLAPDALGRTVAALVARVLDAAGAVRAELPAPSDGLPPLVVAAQPLRGDDSPRHVLVTLTPAATPGAPPAPGPPRSGDAPTAATRRASRHG